MRSAATETSRPPRARLIGSAPEALVSAITAIVAMEAGCSPREVMLTVLGAPPPGSSCRGAKRRSAATR